MAALTGLPWRIVAGGLTVRVRLAPKANRNRVAGPVALADRGVAIRATVTAAPESGKANARPASIAGTDLAVAVMLRAWCTATDKTALAREHRNERDRS